MFFSVWCSDPPKTPPGTRPKSPKTLAIVPRTAPQGSQLTLTGLFDRAKGYAAEARSPRTREAYRAAFGAFVRWARGRRLPVWAPETVAAYLTHLADQGRKPATLEVVLAAISEAARVARKSSPRQAACVRAVRSGIRRKLGTAQDQRAPLLPGQLRAILAELPEGLLGVRDRALLLVGFAGALRRSELVALTVGDVEWVEDGARIVVRRSKTDQEGAGQAIGIPFGSAPERCPVRSLRAWLEASGIAEGPIFREVDRHERVGTAALAGRSVARIVKRSAEAAGMDASHISGHSLRAGLATAAAKAGKTERTIMRQTRHRSERMVRRYIRDAELFVDNAAAGLL